MSAGPDGLPDAPDADDLRAAEYVLGTLPGPERALLAAARRSDPETEARIGAWERRLAPLSRTVPEVAPPPQVWPAIAGALRGADTAGATIDPRVAQLSRSVRRWRRAAIGGGLVAAGLALFVAAGPVLRPAEPPGRYVAVVTSGGDLPALIVSVDTRDGTAQVRPVAARAPDGRSLELWYIAPGQAPRTLGLVGASASRVALPKAAAGDANEVFAVSSEPPGGSPTGQPTGPVLYTGKLIRD